MWREYDDLLSKQIDPQKYRNKNKDIALKQSKNTFESFAWEHFETLKITLKDNTLVRKKRLVALVYSYIGDMPINETTSPKMLEVLLDIQKNSMSNKGKVTEKGERCASIANSIFRYASARGYCDTNPVSSVNNAISPHSYGHRPAVTNPTSLTKLLLEIETLKAEPNTIN